MKKYIQSTRRRNKSLLSDIFKISVSIKYDNNKNYYFIELKKQYKIVVKNKEEYSLTGY
jgi:hypothetical protein